MTVNCKGKLVDLSTPRVMGIINITPDSFYDGSKYKDETEIIAQVETMLINGASFIDLGAYSSRPGADHVSENEELGRIIPLVKQLLKTFPEILISIDTFRSKVADECLAHGAAIINDISAGTLDPKIFEIVGKHQAPYIMMHMKGTPSTMQGMTNYKDLLKEILYYFSEKVAMARTYGINDIIIDPGFGFAKTMEQNYEILRKFKLLHAMDLPILTGVSRKSMIYRLLQTTPKNALNGSTALHMYALANGSQILRVHDVKEAMECVHIFKAIIGCEDRS
ncbi:MULTISPECIES: dihydropteroate synthase [unclassified Arenibacter]|jgi:dihydropteroate synthase|uniref:dihydropteroate synthase n=1 Tax=unclassified Arenibacter TaxID=2615047 RepID=UPI000E34DB06|nr:MULTISPECIES: dihydropteroate synthase [unclassified Arenibacter]MCM4164528.1 dihydropteroate synthase [Arenibacter sp. A80]RFT55613.1 dihydropteroate synthase [Arenibacter sp. P308M17]